MPFSETVSHFVGVAAGVGAVLMVFVGLMLWSDW